MGERWTLAQRCKNDVLYALVSVLLVALRPFPHAWLRALGGALGRVAYHVLRPVRLVAQSNIARVYPTKDRTFWTDLAKRSFETMGAWLGDTFALLGGAGENPTLCPETQNLLKDALAEGRGLLVLSAHLGPWERVGKVLAETIPNFHIVARESYDPRFTHLYEKLRGNTSRVIFRGARHAGLHMARVLRRGGALGIPMDLRSRVPSEAVPFLGVRALVPSGPARLAIMTGAAVIVVTAQQGEDGTLQITGTRIPRQTEPTALLGQVCDELSRRILQIPAHWPWMHDRFRV